ncbi:MAG: deoxyribodipyrimidine photo-lyase [Candidatus Nanopelagicales bacterium]
MPTLLWFRRDLRVHDHPALLEAAREAAADGDGRVLPLFVLDPAVWDPAGPVRRAYLLRSLAALRADLGGTLLVRAGDPSAVVPAVAADSGAGSVHISADFGPYGSARDLRVEAGLAGDGRRLVRTGSPYAVAPGRVTKDDGTAFRVYTPFFKAWLRHGWRAPAPDPDPAPTWWSPRDGDPLPDEPDLGDLVLPPAGEAAAYARWDAFRATGLAAYADDRNRPDLPSTSALGHHLKWGEIHPRTLLAELGDTPGEEVFRKELAWREFYADVLAQRPESARHSLDERFVAMTWDAGTAADEALEAWAAGRTGYPFVDAGMRQLRAEGWMHNRLRMVVASFLVKDLHLPWQRGARHFLHWLRDGDLASNSHGWQWTAGSGTDAAPYHRIFNPVTQGLRFDPDGDYVRRYVPELRHLPGAAAHEPWDAADGYAHGYPPRLVDHAVERTVALARLDAVKGDPARRTG